MKPIARTSTGIQWLEVSSVADALRVGDLMRTSFGWDFRDERNRGGNGRYFVLGEQCLVAGRVPGSGEWSTQPYNGRILGPATGQVRYVYSAPLFGGVWNTDPFTHYNQDIDELARAIGVEITQAAYPWRGGTEVSMETAQLNGSSSPFRP